MKKYFLPLLLPILIAQYPLFFLYQHNIQRVTPEQVWKPLLILLLGTILLFLLFYYIGGRNPQKAGIISSFIILEFNMYGTVYSELSRQQYVPIQVMNFLPVYLLVSIYLSVYGTRLFISKYETAYNPVLIVVAGLILFNLIPSIYIEAQDAISNNATRIHQSTAESSEIVLDHDYPDIYYIILDEYANPQTVEDYWHYSSADFEQSLVDLGFIITSNSRGLTSNTMVEIASRLNNQSFDDYANDFRYLNNHINDNLVTKKLRQLGYTTISLVTVGMDTKGFSDYSLSGTSSSGWGVDEFSIMLIEQTALNPVWDIWTSRINPEDQRIRDSVIFAIENVTNLDDYPSPKFVYVHLNLPHPPFVFDENGGSVPSIHRRNFNYYLGQYKFASKQGLRMVKGILENYDTSIPPIIILQSDHGLRAMNFKDDPDAKQLLDYPMDEQNHIFNAMFLPEVEPETITDDLDPISIFPLIFEEYFNISLTNK